VTAVTAERGRAVWAAALGLTLLVGIFPQFAIGALGPQLRTDLGLAPADLGIVFAGFLGLGVLGSPVAGPLVDRIGGRRSCLGLMIVSGAALLGASFADSGAGLVAGVLPAGLAMAFANPGTNRWASAAKTAQVQATLVGVAQAGVQAGALLAGALAALSVVGLDWRGALRVGAALALCGAVAAWLGPEDARPAGTSAPGRVAGTSTRDRDADRRDLRALASYAMLMGGGTAIVFAYLPTYAVDVGRFSVAAAGATTMVFGGTALVCRLGLGVVIRRPDQVGPRLLIGMALGSAVAIGLIAAGAAEPSWIWVGAVVFGATGTTWPAVAFLAVVRASPPGGAGRVTGWVTAAFYLGLLVTPPLTGRLIDTVGYRWLWAVAVGCYLAATVPVRSAPRAVSG
jgi:predicted MFS family arabinose efflux permease